MKLLIVTVLCFALFTSTSGQAVSLLKATLFRCNNMLEQFLAEKRFSIMKSQIEDLRAGLANLYRQDITDKDLENQYALIYKVNEKFISLPKNAVSKLSVLSALSLVSPLNALNSLVPSNPQVFQARVTEHRGIGNLISEASDHLFKILNVLSA